MTELVGRDRNLRIPYRCWVDDRAGNPVTFIWLEYGEKGDLSVEEVVGNHGIIPIIVLR